MYYVIQVQTQKEEKTINEIREHLSEDVLIDVFSPKYIQRKKIKNEWVDVEKPVFPGYIFLETNDIKEVFHQLYYVEGFTKLLGREENTENFLPLNEYESRMVDILYGKENKHILGVSEVSLKEGMKIKVLSGPLFGLEGLIKKIDLHKRQVRIAFPIAGRPVEASVSIDIVSEIQ